MPSYSTKRGLPIYCYGTNGSATDMPSYGTRGRMPIWPVTVLREDCQYAQLRYLGKAADIPSYGNKGKDTGMPSYGT